MSILKKSFLLLAVLFCIPNADAQVDESQQGAWYMYFFNTTFRDGPWGIQGDIQYRNWRIIGDLEQLLLRGGITYLPRNTSIKFTLGYGNVTTGTFGDDDATTGESRIYQEALYPTQLGNRFYVNHRLRYEQRFVENQDLRTRFRYNLFLNVPLNKPELIRNTIYLALYNEVFINGERSIGQGKTVELFDRNRFYAGLGYVIQKGLNVQLGFMNQTTDSWAKNQFQVSLHHRI